MESDYFSTHSAGDITPISHTKSSYHYVHNKWGVLQQGSVPCACDVCMAGDPKACMFRPLSLRDSVEREVNYTADFRHRVRGLLRKCALVVAKRYLGTAVVQPVRFDYEGARRAAKRRVVAVLTVNELKQQLRVRGAPISGNKQALQQRLCARIGVAWDLAATVVVIDLPAPRRRRL